MRRSIENIIVRMDNNRIKKYRVLIALALFPCGAGAQESMLFDDSNSPLQTEWQQMGLRPEVQMRDALLSNPALMSFGFDSRRSFFNDNPESTPRVYPLTVTIDGSEGRMKGDFVPAEGNRFKDYSVKAGAMMRDEKNFLYGKASFTAGSHENIGWNALRSPQTYWPYVVADSTGGNVGYETYNLLVAYSYRPSTRFTFGFSGEYKGDFAFRKTDPRIENITSWFTLKGGVAYKLGEGSRVALDFDWQLHRQHAAINHFRSGQFAGFFMEYGFGMYDYIHSPIYNSMKHQQHQQSYETNLSYASDATRPFRLTARIGYSFDKMNTEENIHKLNLYRAMTNRLRADVAALWNNDSWGVSMNGRMASSQRKGREYVFERYVSATVDGVDVYDYRKIGQQDRYTMNALEGQAQLKLSAYLTDANTVSLFGGVRYYERKEKYRGYNYLLHNALLTPQGGVELKHASRLLDARLTAGYGHTTAPKHAYRVGVDMDRHTEYQHAFSTYAYYAYNADVIGLDAEVAHTFEFGRMGVVVQWMWVNGHRLNDVVYDADRYAESIPSARKHTVSPEPDRHDRHWMKLGLFVEF